MQTIHSLLGRANRSSPESLLQYGDAVTGRVCGCCQRITDDAAFGESPLARRSNLSIEPPPHETEQPLREENDHHDKNDSERDQVRELVPE